MITTLTNGNRLLRLFDRWDTDFPTLCIAFREAFAADCVWENAGMPAVRGYEEAYQKILVPSNAAPIGMDAIRVETVNRIESGLLVFHERIDHILRADGSLVVSIAIAGITEFDDHGLIRHWRDYCDPTPLHELVNAAAGQEGNP